MNFNLAAQDKNSKARAGSFETDHGIVETPRFMPVGTQGTVKAVSQKILKNEIIPIFDKIVKIEKIKGDNKSVMLKESISPQFIVGATQGILVAIQEYMKKSAMGLRRRKSETFNKPPIP